MFCFFKNDSYFNFWSNRVGDIFADSTCIGLKWDKSQIDLVYYEGLENVPEFYNFDSNKILSILKKEIHQEESLNENGEPVLNEDGSPVLIDVESLVLDKQIDPEVFMSKGIIIKPC